ncbi:MAG: hypothetical protein CMJ29_07195 [Phycisphaerae bacterium]|nr:hypothetical protein [Phycisphaerae bacterium]
MNGVPDLIVIDLDGTLLCPRGQVSESNRRALAEARGAGVRIMIATGRTHVECRQILEAIDYQGPMVVASGAALIDLPSESTLDRDLMDQDDVVVLSEIMRDHDCASLILKDRHAVGYDYLIVGSQHLHPVSNWWFDAHGIACRTADSAEEDSHPEDTLRIACIGAPDLMGQAAERVSDRLGQSVSWRHWPAVGREGEVVHMLEVFGSGVDKWTMVERYAIDQGIPRERVAAIGDGLNDIQLLRECGFGIAVDNADDQVIEAADARTGCHSQDGVADAVDRLLRGWS